MDEPFRAARKLALELHQKLETLELGASEASDQLRLDVQSGTDQLTASVQSLEGLLVREPANKRDMWAIRIQQLSDDAAAIRTSFHKYNDVALRKQREKQERQQLLESRFRGGGGDNLVAVDRAYEENRKLNQANQQVDEFIQQGSAQLYELREQKNKLKNAQRRIFDVANQLGISVSIMRMIERRTLGDQIIVYSGMVLTVVVFWAAWVYLR